MSEGKFDPIIVPSLTNVNVKFLEYPNNSYWKTQYSSAHFRINFGLGILFWLNLASL